MDLTLFMDPHHLILVGGVPPPRSPLCQTTGRALDRKTAFHSPGMNFQNILWNFLKVTDYLTGQVKVVVSFLLSIITGFVSLSSRAMLKQNRWSGLGRVGILPSIVLSLWLTLCQVKVIRSHGSKGQNVYFGFWCWDTWILVKITKMTPTHLLSLLARRKKIEIAKMFKSSGTAWSVLFSFEMAYLSSFSRHQLNILHTY